MSHRFAVAIMIAGSLLAAAPANAADLKILAAGPIERPFHALVAGFTRETGHRAEAEFDTVGVIQKRIKAGEKPDIIILSPGAMDDLDKSGLLVAGTRIEVGRAASGLAVRAGAPVPDISTPEALRKTLLAARTVAYVDPATGANNGIFFAGLIKKLNIADEVNKKAVLVKRGHEVATTLAEGKAEIGNTSLTELAPHKGVRVIGPIPDPLGTVTSYVAAVATSSAHGDAARALIAYFMRPASREQFKADGL
jgi:molybdate transport system substrate-binding protein